MKIEFFFILFLLFACSSHQKYRLKCTYQLKDLLKVYGSTNFKKTKSRTEDWTDYEEKKDSASGNGLYQFDKNGILRFYAFLYNENDYSFSIKYDSLGNIVVKTGPEIVKWFLDKSGSDSLDITFLLYSIEFSYGRISLKIGNKNFNNITLFKSKNSNLIGATVRALQIKGKEEKIYIKGTKLNTCTNDTTIFTDSIFKIP